ncbi:hypothetical protein [Priestia sp. TSO9]|uniref:hypothetical protein n=1 Tax=Priestia sp. TSO9 TaxID=2885632 RepID=UPI001E64A10B|nr:hypothetical protein [Priestia sp. TSO9]
MKKVVQLVAALTLLLSISVGGSVANASTSSKFERVTWEKLESKLEKENFDLKSISEEDINLALEAVDGKSDIVFKRDKDGFGTLDTQTIETEFDKKTAIILEIGLANINYDIEKGITEINEDNQIVKGPNYDKYVDEDKENTTSQMTTMSLSSCKAKSALKAMVGGAATGAVGGAIAGGGAGAIPGGAGGFVTGGVGYYATCWW